MLKYTILFLILLGSLGIAGQDQTSVNCYPFYENFIVKPKHKLLEKSSQSTLLNTEEEFIFKECITLNPTLSSVETISITPSTLAYQKITELLKMKIKNTLASEYNECKGFVTFNLKNSDFFYNPKEQVFTFKTDSEFLCINKYQYEDFYTCEIFYDFLTNNWLEIRCNTPQK